MPEGRLQHELLHGGHSRGVGGGCQGGFCVQGARQVLPKSLPGGGGAGGQLRGGRERAVFAGHFDSLAQTTGDSTFLLVKNMSLIHGDWGGYAPRASAAGDHLGS